MTSPMAYYQNQLQFNPEVPTRPVNMAVKFHQPQPLIIEKFSYSVPTAPTNAALVLNQSQAMQLSTVSEADMSMAVQLAKRDLRKQKQDAEIQKHLDKQDKAKKNKVKAKPTPRPRYNTQHVRPQPHKHVPQQDNKKKKAEKPNRPPSKAILDSIMKDNSIQIPPAVAWHDVTTMSHEEFTLREIKRLKLEMDNCISQMKKIEEIARNGKWVARVPVGCEDLPEDEIRRRRETWAEQQDIRSSHVIYTLQQQVKAIQADLSKVTPPFSKKDRRMFLQRVVATYRKAVRGLQTLLNQLVDYDLTKGLPHPCRQFQVLMKQLSLCTAQLDMASNSQLPDSIKEVFEEILKNAEKAEITLHEPDPEGKQAVPKPAIHKEVLPNNTSIQSQKHQDHHIAPDIHNKGNMSVMSASPERAHALRQGIEALVRAAEITEPVFHRDASPPVNQRQPSPHQGYPTSTGSSPNRDNRSRWAQSRGKAVSWQVPLGPKQPSNRQHRGLLLPHNLQTRRQRLYKQHLERQRKKQERDQGPMHYALPTVSYKLRAVPTHDIRERRQLSSERAPASPGATERRSRSLSADRTWRPLSAERLYQRALSAERESKTEKRLTDRATSPIKGLSPRRDSNNQEESREAPYPRKDTSLYGPWRTAQREIQKQVWLDSDRSHLPKNAKDLEDERKAEIQKLNKMRSEVLQPTDWVDNALDKIREELNPLLENSEVEVVGLAEQILQDALDVSVRERQGQDDAEQDALLLMNAPSLQTILQKLTDMENEQAAISQRWATIVYEDSNGRRARFQDVAGSEQPSTPQLLEITNDRSASTHQLHEKQENNNNNADEAQSIIFTKPNKPSRRYEKLHLSSVGADAPALRIERHVPHKPRDTRVPLFLTNDIIERIHNNRENFKKYLEKTSTLTHGKFNPWHLVEVMSDDILEECLQDVTKELEDINMDIARNIYETEFKQTSNNSSPDLTMIKDDS